MDIRFIVHYSDSNQDYTAEASSQDEAEALASMLYDEDYKNIRFEKLRI